MEVRHSLFLLRDPFAGLVAELAEVVEQTVSVLRIRKEGRLARHKCPIGVDLHVLHQRHWFLWRGHRHVLGRLTGGVQHDGFLPP